jgi:transcriptional regulator GlxA family with amidase domain
MVVFLQRPGGQAQFSVWTESALPVTKGLREILDSVVSDPRADHSIAAMAARAAVSERHLVRMFRVQVGITPARFVEQARLEAAKVLLAAGVHSQQAVARRAGFGSADSMRRTFRRNLGVSPSVYRSRFRTTGINQRLRWGHSGTRTLVLQSIEPQRQVMAQPFPREEVCGCRSGSDQ